jgi:hypothetical protein
MCTFSEEREKYGWVRAKEDAKFWTFGYCARLERYRLGPLVVDARKESQRSERRNIEVTRNGDERLCNRVSTRSPVSTMSISDHVDSSSVYRNVLRFLFDIPPRFLARLRSLDRLLDREAESNPAISFLLSYGTDPGAPAAHMPTPPPSTFPHYPGPWSFFASGYAVSLFAMVRHTHLLVSNTSLSAQRHCS